MAITFNTNLSAITAQRNLNATTAKSGSSLSKLTSGSRVPSAKDDAAALAIGSKLRAEVAALEQASLNAGQAVSLLQIADGALSTVGDILVRLKSLASQSSSGQLADAERVLLNQEFTSLRSEVDRIANDTDFNGTTLLNGGDRVVTVTESRAGGLDGQGITLSFDTAVTNDDDVFRVQYDSDVSLTPDEGNLTVFNLTTGESQTINVATAIQAVTGEAAATLTTDLGAGETVDINFSALGVTVTLDSSFNVDGDLNLYSAAAVDGTSTAQAPVTTNSTYTFLNGGTLTGAQLAAITSLSNDGLLSLSVDDSSNDTLDFNATTGLAFSTDGVTFSSTLSLTADGSTANTVYVSATGVDNAFMRIDIASATDVVGANGDAASTIEIDLQGLARVEESNGSTTSFDFRVGTGVVAANDEITVSITAATTAALGISSAVIDSQSAAETAIGTVTAAIDTLSSARAGIGANQSRLEFAASSIAVAIENSTAAQSSLLDVDVASEITKFTSTQVLLQAGISLLAQANQQPALLLRLLQ